jgi:hypothetical protein
MKIKTTHIIIAILLVLLLLETTCNEKPEEMVKVVTKTETVTDTITKTIIKEVPKEVIVNKYIDKEGEKVIVYVDKPNDSSIVANQYQTELISNNATAKLDITTIGELLDVQGLITYPEKETIKETTITRDASGLFIYGSMPISSQLTTPELGVMFQIKNKLIIGVGAQYNTINDNLSAVGTIAVKL